MLIVVSLFVSRSFSYEVPPISISTPIVTANDLGYTSFTDTNQMKAYLINTCRFDAQTATNFANKMKYANEAKTSIHDFNMGLGKDSTWRNALMKVYLVSAKKVNGVTSLHSKIISTKCEINSYYVEVHTRRKKFLGITYSTKRTRVMKWRPLTASELKSVNDKIEAHSSSQIQQQIRTL